MSSSVTLTYIIKAKFRRKDIPAPRTLMRWKQLSIFCSLAASYLLLTTFLLEPIEGSFLPAVSISCGGTTCLHGNCVDNNRCECHRGWQGPACDTCDGRLK